MISSVVIHLTTLGMLEIPLALTWPSTWPFISTLNGTPTTRRSRLISSTMCRLCHLPRCRVGQDLLLEASPPTWPEAIQMSTDWIYKIAAREASTLLATPTSPLGQRVAG